MDNIQQNAPYKTGKLPARPDSIKLKFKNYLDKKALKLPKHPDDNFGHERVIASTGWGMLGNDKYGCCVWSGAAHETRMWGYMGGVHGGAWFRDQDVLSDYSATTGFDPANPQTDNGTDMQKAAKYRRDIGIVDGHKRRHKVAAYLALDAGNLEQHLQALYLFGAVGIGIRFPSCFMNQFMTSQPWSYDANHWGGNTGHYIPLVSMRKKKLNIVTWAKLHPMEIDAWERVNDESVVYLSEEMLINGKSPEAFDYASLQQDLNALTRAA